MSVAKEHMLDWREDGSGEKHSVTPTCSCGWSGSPEYPSNDEQYSSTRRQWEAHRDTDAKNSDVKTTSLGKFTYLVTYAYEMHDHSNLFPFVVETTSPISSRSHFNLIGQLVRDRHKNMVDKFVPMSVSILVAGIPGDNKTAFSITRFESV